MRKQDEPITIDVVLKAASNILDLEWNRATKLSQRKRIVEMGVWFICGFPLGLQGEEMILSYSGPVQSIV